MISGLKPQKLPEIFPSQCSLLEVHIPGGKSRTKFHGLMFWMWISFLYSQRHRLGAMYINVDWHLSKLLS